MFVKKEIVLQVLKGLLLLYTTVFVLPMWHDFLHENGHAVAYVTRCTGGSAVVSLGEYEFREQETSPGQITYDVYPGYFFHSLYRTSQCAPVQPPMLANFAITDFYLEFGNDTSKYPAEYIELLQACEGNLSLWMGFAGPLFGLVFTYATVTVFMFVAMAYFVPCVPAKLQISSPHGLQKGLQKGRLISALKRAPLVLIMPERAFLNHLSTETPWCIRILYAFCIRFIQADLINEFFYGWLPGRTIIFTWGIFMDGPGWWAGLTGASEQTMLIVSYVLYVPLLGLYLYGFWLMFRYTRRVLAENRHARLRSSGNAGPSETELRSLKADRIEERNHGGD